VAWLRITGGVLFIAGMVGLIFGAESGRVSLALCIAGMAAWGAALIAQRRRGKQSSLGEDDDALDELLDLLDGSTSGHHNHHRGHGHDVGHDHDAGHDTEWH
jgi:hypothetical protein